MDSDKAVLKKYDDLTVKDLFEIVLKYKLIVIIFAAAGLITGIIVQFALTADEPKTVYHTKATMVVTSKTEDGSYQISGSENHPSWSDVDFAQSLVPTVTELAKSDYVLNLVIEEINDIALTPVLLRKFITCTAVEKTTFIGVAIEWPDENESIAIINALMNVLPQAMTEKLNIGSVTVVDRAAATPETAWKTLYIFGCTAAGIFAGLCFAVILGLFNVKVKSAQDIKTYLKLDTIAELPYLRQKGTGSSLFSNPRLPVEYRESCSVLGSVFEYIAIQKNIKVIYVTSAVSDEGKTTVSINLSMALATKGKNVVLIDCDTQRPAIGESLGQHKLLPSLQDVLKDKTDLNGALIKYHENMMVLRSDIGEANNTKDFAVILDALRGGFDYIIIDTPPVGLLSDALSFNSCTDGVLFVIRHDYANMGLIAESINYIKDSGASILGCVLNASRQTAKFSREYYYRQYNPDIMKRSRKKMMPRISAR